MASMDLQPASLRDDLQDRLSCGLCMEIYDERDRLPKLLPCAHTICLHCLSSMMSKSKSNRHFPCPFCRENIPNSKTPSKFKTNLSMIDMLGLLGSKSMSASSSMNSMPQFCDFTCKRHPGCTCTCRCLTCAVDLCTSCLLEEVRDPQHKDHEIVDASLVREDPAFGQNAEPLPPSPTACPQVERMEKKAPPDDWEVSCGQIQHEIESDQTDGNDGVAEDHDSSPVTDSTSGEASEPWEFVGGPEEEVEDAQALAQQGKKEQL